MRNNILVVLVNDIYIRNFFTSGSFELLEKDNNVYYCSSEIVKKLKKEIPSDKYAGTFKFISINIFYLLILNKISMRALRKKSATFAIKIKKLSTIWIYRLFYFILSLPLVYPMTKLFILSLFKKNFTLGKIVKQKKIDLVIFPFTGIEATAVELIKLSKKYKFKTLFLVNGWDNLSSKGVLPLLPDYLGVWGPQSLTEAKNLLNMPDKRIFLLGCARYAGYFERKGAAHNPFSFPYILFAGSTTACDEITTLKIFDEIIENNKSNLTIIYRPHPWREKRLCFDCFKQEDFKHVIIDPQVEEDYYKEKIQNTESTSSSNYPSLQYYTGLLKYSNFIISPMSSMILEAGLFDVPALILAHDDGIHKITPSLLLQYEHFKGADKISGWFIVESLSEMKNKFLYMIEEFSNDQSSRRFSKIISEQMKRYLFFDEETYSKRLLNSVNAILKK